MRKTNAAEIDPVEKAKHAPVALPSGGSFDVQDLQKKLDKAVDGKPEKRDTAVEKAISDSAGAEGSSFSVTNALPGHDVYKVETLLAPGSEQGDGTVVGEQTVTEFVQVFNPSRSDEVRELVEMSSQPSETLSMTRMGSSPAPNSPPSETAGTSNPEAVEAAIIAVSDPK